MCRGQTFIIVMERLWNTCEKDIGSRPVVETASFYLDDIQQEKDNH